jgi:GNAT superfamily N-acetyltransferase
VSWAIRRATSADAALLGEHRGNVWRDAGRHTDAEVLPQIPVWAAWLAGAIEDGSYVAWIAADAGGAAVGSAGLLLRATLPRPGFPADRDGRVHSVYVIPELRRRGIARALMAELIDFARSSSLIQLVLHPSDDGRPLYLGLGFVAIEEMALRFPAPA